MMNKKTAQLMDINYRVAESDDIDHVLTLVERYHHFESIQICSKQRRSAIQALLNSDLPLGFIFIAETAHKLVGYIAVCYGYSIEFGGPDAFIDEFYVSESIRGKGVGTQLLQQAKIESKKMQ